MFGIGLVQSCARTPSSVKPLQMFFRRPPAANEIAVLVLKFTLSSTELAYGLSVSVSILVVSTTLLGDMVSHQDLSLPRQHTFVALQCLTTGRATTVYNIDRSLDDSYRNRRSLFSGTQGPCSEMMHNDQRSTF